MRDFIVFGIVFGALPFVLRHPWMGVLLWIWVSVMNPHRLTWGPAFDFPFAQIVALTTFAGIVFTKDRRRLILSPPVVVLAVLIVWMSITTLTALEPAAAKQQWERVIKIQTMTFVALFLLNSRKHVDGLVWMCVISVGFYAVKGGLFTLLTGGGQRVNGPPDSFIEENNSLALATIMTIPLFFYLLQESRNKWLRGGLIGASILAAASVLGSYSRGALLAVSAMLLVLWTRSRQKALIGMFILVLIVVLIPFMPDSWTNRMWTIKEYDQDGSALGRLNVWATAINIAKDRLLGAGFEYYSYATFAVYAPNPQDLHSAHSIYFQMLGEHGVVGLVLFVLVWALTWVNAGSIRRAARTDPEIAWAGNLASMVQVSIVGYAAGGAFLNLSYFDLPYYELVAVAVTRDIVRRRSRELKSEPAPAPAAERVA